MENELICHYCKTENVPGYTHCKGCGKLRKDIYIDKQRGYSALFCMLLGIFIMAGLLATNNNYYTYDWTNNQLKTYTYDKGSATFLAFAAGFSFAFSISMLVIAVYYFKRANKKLRR